MAAGPAGGRSGAWTGTWGPVCALAMFAKSSDVVLLAENGDVDEPGGPLTAPARVLRAEADVVQTSA